MATAVVNKITISNKDFDPPVEETRHIVNKCSSLEEHNHEGDAAGILSEIILLEMAEKVEVKGGAKKPSSFEKQYLSSFKDCEVKPFLKCKSNLIFGKLDSWAFQILSYFCIPKKN